MDTRILILLIYLLNNNTNTSSTNGLHNIKNHLKNIEIKGDYTKEKIQVAKKITPLLPAEYSTTFNRSVGITEKVVKILELKDFLSSTDETPVVSLDLEPKERLQRIYYTLQDEAHSSETDEVGLVLDLVLNMEKYKKMFNAYTSLNKNRNNLSDSEKVSMLMEVFMAGSNEKDKEKMNEMYQMFEILKVVNNNNNDNKEDKPNED